MVSEEPEQPLGVWGVVTTALRVYFAKANTLFTIVLILVVPISVLTSLLIGATVPDELKNLDPQTTTDNPFEGLTFEDFRGFLLVALVSGIIGLVVTMVAIGACFKAVGDALAGREASWRASIRAAADKALALIWIPVLIFLLFLAAMIGSVLVIAILSELVAPLGAIAAIALFCGAVYIFVSWSVAIPVLMDEGTGGMRALSRSAELVKGRWWPTFGAYLIAGVLLLVLTVILDAVFDLNSIGDENLFLTTLGSAISQILFTPLQAALVGVVYFDLRRRKGGTTPAASGPPLPPPPPPPPPML